MASTEECDSVDAKATVEEAKVDTDEESKSESEKSVKVYLTEQEKDEKKMKLRRLDLLIPSCAELVKRKPTLLKI